MNDWIDATKELPKIEKDHSRTQLPLYVVLDSGVMTIADFTKSKFKNNAEWVSLKYEPIWICRERGVDISGTEINVKYWQRQPELPKH